MSFPLFFTLLLLGNEPGMFDLVIVNDDLEAAYDQLKSALMEVSLCLNEMVFKLSATKSIFLKKVF